MNRAVAPLAIGATVGAWAWWRESVLPLFDGGLGRLVARTEFELLGSLPTKADASIFERFWQITAVPLILHFWPELWKVCRLVLRCIVFLGSVCFLDFGGGFEVFALLGALDSSFHRGGLEPLRAGSSLNLR